MENTDPCNIDDMFPLDLNPLALGQCMWSTEKKLRGNEEMSTLTIHVNRL